MKVISTSPSFAKYTDEPIIYLKEHGFELLAFPADVSLDTLRPHLVDADAMIVAFTEINAELLDCAPKLKIVCKHGVGVDNIDLLETRKRNIWATNVPDANKHAVADYTFTLLLGIARQLTQANELTKKGEWPRIFTTDVYAKTIGIIGLGNIGKQVAARAGGFSMKVLAYDFLPNDEYARKNDITFVGLEALLAQSDFITLHVPLTEQTRSLINAERLKQMKKSAFVINASRGGVVDENALYEALQNKTIAGAASDVFEVEPLQTHPLFSLPNFIATSHVAGYTDGAISALGTQCVKDIVTAIVKKQRPQYVVNGL